jgi:hypothetical protein
MPWHLADFIFGAALAFLSYHGIHYSDIFQVKFNSIYFNGPFIFGIISLALLVMGIYIVAINLKCLILEELMPLMKHLHD